MSQLRAVPAHIPVPAPMDLGQGIWSLPVPLPGNALRFVVPYALEVPGGLVLIDAGWDDDEPWNALVDGLALRAVGETHAHLLELVARGLVAEVPGGSVVRWRALEEESPDAQP